MPTPAEGENWNLSRRHFLKTMGVSAIGGATPAALAQAAEKMDPEKIYGPGAVPVKLRINGNVVEMTLEPRVTLLDALRNYQSFTGAKEACDRATCGACTVLIDNVPVYACMVLAIAAQGREILTVEGLARDGKLSAVQEAFVKCDGLMCGFCTPGFVMSVTALLQRNPKPTLEQVKEALAGNLCRCGTQPHVFQAALQAAGISTARLEPEVVTWSEHGMA